MEDSYLFNFVFILTIRSGGMKMEDYVVTLDHNGLLQFIINRPDRRNAINYEVMDGLLHAINECETNPSVKVLLIRGVGDKAFCSGGDLKVFEGLKTEEEAYGMLSKMGEIVYRLATLPKPTIAYINGIAIGGGCEIATSCDYRIMSSTAKAGFVQGNLAITSGWGGGTLLLERIPSSDALHLLWSANVYSANELEKIGYIQQMIHRSEEPNEIPFVQDLLSKPVTVLEAYKKLFLAKWDLFMIKKRINKEIRECARLWALDEHHHAVAKFLNK